MSKLINKILFAGLLLALSCLSPTGDQNEVDFNTDNIVQQADQYLQQEPVPLTDFRAVRSAGGPHDFYSEGDYWWPDPENPDGPYIRRDGQTNPDNFTAHRIAMRNLSRWVATLVAAYKITGDEKYANHALKHLKAWFTDPATLMNPSLLYAQAIKGRVTGRGIGIIDTIHLIEVAKSIQVLQDLGYLKREDFNGLQTWFKQFVSWLTTHPFGIDERDHGNNHSTWWAAQVAAFADLTQEEDLLELTRQQFKKLLAEQMDGRGAFPDELSRTKPYNYTLFNLEGYAVLARIASTEEDNLWKYETPKGSLYEAFQFMFPYIKDKSEWIKAPDVQYFDQLPIQSGGLLFAALAYEEEAWLEVWEQLNPKVKANEIDRTYPIRQPILWVD
ncbi:MAG TPA: alginate lyase family protein [Saprospiraceae bacterium]|nr:alginate lyase family protein [Saprospiraceae bacterium]